MRYTSNIRYALGASVLTFLTGLAGCAPTRSTGTPAATPPPLAYTKVLEGVSDLGQAEARVTAALKSRLLSRICG